MNLRIDTRTYTNMILTVIAVFLFALVLHAFRIAVAPNAQAQPAVGPHGLTNTTTSGRGGTGFAASGRSAPVDAQNAPVIQDIAVAAATTEVAAANRDIAAALRDVAKAIEGIGAAMGPGFGPSVVGTTPPAAVPPATSPTGSAPVGSPAHAEQVESLNISVEPSR